jgi:hypothetical protein
MFTLPARKGLEGCVHAPACAAAPKAGTLILWGKKKFVVRPLLILNNPWYTTLGEGLIMNKLVICIVLLVTGTLCFAQQSLVIIGKIPESDNNLYRIQMGAFKVAVNAENTLSRLKNAGYEPVRELYRGFTRVFLGGIPSRDIRRILGHIETLGFREAWISPDQRPYAAERVIMVPPPAAPYPERRETVPERPAVVPERRETVPERPVVIPERRETVPEQWETGDSVWPPDNPDTVNPWIRFRPVKQPPEGSSDRNWQETYISADEAINATPGTVRLTEYRTDQTSRLAYRFVSPQDGMGIGGIDILGKGQDDIWMWTTYKQWGFSYDINGVHRGMTDGVLRSSNGLELTVEPSFVSIDGISCLQLEHKLKNTGRIPVSGQKFSAGADIMLHNNDHVPIALNEYGLIIADVYDDAIADTELKFIGKAGSDITPVNTLRIGPWEQGDYLRHLYDNGVSPGYLPGSDSTMAFSYQNITLGAGETKSFIVRFMLVKKSGR